MKIFFFKDSSDMQKGIIALVWLALTFAIQGLFVRYFNTAFTILQQVYIRVFIAFLIGLVIYKNSLDFHKLTKISKNEWFLIIFRSILLYGMGTALWSAAIVFTKYSNVAFIQTLPLTGLFGFLLFQEKFSWKKTVLLSTACLGAVIIGVSDFSHLLFWGKGDLLALISAVGYSIGYVTTKWHSNLLNEKELSMLIFFFAAIFLLLTSLVLGEGSPSFIWSWQLLLLLLLAGFFNVVNIFLLNYGFRKVEATLASNILTLESLFVVVLALIFYREFPNLKELVGGVIILLSVVLMNRISQSRKVP